MINSFMENMRSKRYVLIIILITLCVTVSGLIIILLLKRAYQHNTSLSQGNQIQGNHSLLINPTSLQQQSFTVVATSPKKGTINVPTGEITLTFVTDVLLASKNSFSVSSNPQIPNMQITDAFPANNASMTVLGGLQPATTYTITIHNQKGTPVYSWDFSTASISAGQSSSGLIQQQEKDFIKTYEPLFQYTPFQNDDFYVQYADKLTLEVDIRNPDTEKVKQEVNDWIKSHGVDPATHTINYVNDF